MIVGCILVKQGTSERNRTDDKRLVNHFPPPVSKVIISKILNDMLDQFRNLGCV